MVCQRFFANGGFPLKLNIAVLQIDLAFGDPVQNLAKVKQKIQRLVEKNTKLDVVVLPELWNTAYDLTRLDEIADPEGQIVQQEIGTLAKEQNIHIVAGSIAKKTDQGIYNTLTVFDRNGEKVGEYSKLHLIRLMDEEKYLTPGQSMGLFELDGVPCAGLICYDIRFPEWVRKHILAGAQVLFVPAQWPLSRVKHWRSLLIARAIENQCYVVACNRIGHDPNNAFAGHSMIIDPWGEILAEAEREETSLVVEIDTEQVIEVRKKIPIFEDRRPELY
nr:carbon-nitrogen family hydrolase [Thermoflavimicrobium dichotomicum]